MKTKINLSVIITLLTFAIISGSCIVIVPKHHDNGKHIGWYKAKKKPHYQKKKTNVIVVVPEKKNGRR